MDDPVNKHTPSPVPVHPPEQVINPDWQKIIDDLSDRLEKLSAEKEDLKNKSLLFASDIEALKKSAPKPVAREIDELFSPWDLFFGD